MSYGDDARHLVERFQLAHRYPNFGAALQSMEISGFRGVENLRVEFHAPITAFCGLNGTGKSTLAQLGTCAYKKPSTAALKRYYVKDFFPVSAADPNPFTADARAIFSYSVERGAELQRVTVRRVNTEWSGYKRQPERACHYVGFTQFIPKIERRDFSIYRGHLAQLGENRPLDAEAAKWVAAILGISYDQVGFSEMSHQGRSAELAIASRQGASYSENNMGFGEGRVVYMVRSMEEAPLQSLFVLEEPETSLHGQAQIKLAEYLVNVCGRRGHQILLTTHSSALLDRLPTESIVYLRRQAGYGNVETVPGLAAYQIDSYLRGVEQRKTRTVCVEDDFAKILLAEVLRQYEQDLLAGITILPIGGKQEVIQAVRLLRSAGVAAVGVTDADANHNGKDYVMSMPGDSTPEGEVFENLDVLTYFTTEYGHDIEIIVKSCSNSHDVPNEIARRVMVDSKVVTTEACRAYVRSMSAVHFSSIMRYIAKSLAQVPHS